MVIGQRDGYDAGDLVQGHDLFGGGVAGGENGGAKLVHVSGGMVLLRAA